MKKFDLSQLSAVLDNAYANQGKVLQTTWSELSPTVFLLNVKHRNKLQSWDDVDAKAFLYYQAARNLRKSFGFPAITEQNLADFLKDLKPYTARINNSASKMAFDNLMSKGIDPNDNVEAKAAFDNAHNFAQKAEEQRVADAKNSFPELLELINGDFGKKAELLEDYQETYEQNCTNFKTKINNALIAAYVKFENVIANSFDEEEIAKVENLLQKWEDVLTKMYGKNAPELAKQKAAKYAQGPAMFSKFFA